MSRPVLLQEGGSIEQTATNQTVNRLHLSHRAREPKMKAVHSCFTSQRACRLKEPKEVKTRTPDRLASMLRSKTIGSSQPSPGKAPSKQELIGWALVVHGVNFHSHPFAIVTMRSIQKRNAARMSVATRAQPLKAAVLKGALTWQPSAPPA